MRNFWEYIQEEIGKIQNPWLAVRILVALFTPVLFILLCIFIFIANWDVNVKPIKKYFNQNHIHISSVSPDLQLDSLRVEWGIPYVKPVIVYQDGEEQYSDYHEERDNCIYIFYSDSLIGKLIHHKESAIAGHDYFFKIKKEDHCFYLSAEVKGEYDSIRWEKNQACMDTF